MDGARVEVLMLINGVDVRAYSISYDWEVVEGVIQYLEIFKCCGELVDELKTIREEREVRLKEEAEAAIRVWETRTKKPSIPELPDLVTPIGICPRCDATLMGEPMPGCETSDTGRVFYAECSACPYYYEILLDKETKGHKKVEGG